MKVNMTGMNYSFDAEGNTDKISVSLTGYEGGNSLNATVDIVAEDLNEKESFDDLSRKQIEAKAKSKITGWLK